MEESLVNNSSQTIKQVFKTELIVNIIFDFLSINERFNLCLTNKKIFSFYIKRNKILKTYFELPYKDLPQKIEIPLLNNILSKYKNIIELKTSFGYEPEKLKILFDSNLINLEKLSISNNGFDVGKFINMIELKELSLKWNNYQSEVTNLSFLSNLQNLEILKLEYPKINGNESIDSIRTLKNLKELYLINISKGKKDDLEALNHRTFKFAEILDITPISFCINLEKLELNLIPIESIEFLKNLINLKELSISNIEKIQDLSAITSLVNLEKLKIFNMSSCDVPWLSGLAKLKELKLSYTKIKDLESLNTLNNLEDLDMPNYYNAIDLSQLSNLINLKKLNLNESNITNVTSIKKLIKLEELNIKISFFTRGKDKLSDISCFSNLIHLKKLNLQNWNITDIKPIKSLINLNELDISKNHAIYYDDYSYKHNLTDIYELQFLINLEKLNLSHLSLTNIEPLKSLIKLKELDLSFNSKLKDISPLTGLINLEKLYLRKLSLTNIYPLKGLIKLIELDSSENNNLSDISPLSSLINLKSLNLRDCNITNLIPFKGLINLINLELYGNNNFTDSSPLSNLIHLKQKESIKNQAKQNQKSISGKKLLNIKNNKIKKFNKNKKK